MLVSCMSIINSCAIVQSTLHFEKIVTSKSKKTEVILDYNTTKGAIDTLDKMISYYNCTWKINRWSIIVFSDVPSISAVNAYTISGSKS